MKILEVHIKNLGKYTDTTIRFQDGVNLLYGENESGKSTLYAFIKGMLYGMERGRGRASVSDAFSQYEPWENPNYYAGSIRFESGGRYFKLERNFDKYAKSAELVCEDDGEVLSLQHGDLDMLLEGMDESGFENTVAIGQLKVEINQNLASELKNYAANYYLTGNGDLNLEDALSHLALRKKEVEKEMKEIILSRQEKRELLEQEASFLWQDIHRFQRELEEVKEAVSEQGEKAESESVQVVDKWRVHPIEIIGMLIAIVLAFVFFDRPWNNLIAIVLALAEGLYIWNRVKEGKKKQPEMTADGRPSAAQLRWQQERLISEMKEKQTAHGNLQDALEELSYTGEDYEKKDQQKKALELAMERLQELSVDVHKELSADLNGKASDILAQITEQKYSKLLIDEQLRMHLFTEGKRVPIERVSRGTMEQVYFALRMASIELLYTEEFPVILDDTFVFYDERRLEGVLQWLYHQKSQILIMTCQKREETALRALGIPIHFI